MLIRCHPDKVSAVIDKYKEDKTAEKVLGWSDSM